MVLVAEKTFLWSVCFQATRSLFSSSRLRIQRTSCLLNITTLFCSAPMLICSLWGLYDKDKVHACSVGSDSATTWTVAHRAPLSMEFSRQEYWSGLPFPSPRDLPNPGIEPVSFATLALAGQFFTTAPPGPNPHLLVCFHSCSAFGITGFCPSGHSWLNLSPSFPVFFLYKILHWLLIFLKNIFIYLLRCTGSWLWHANS